MSLLEAQNVHFAYDERPVLRGISVRLGAGEIVALLGPNGSGKSTLLRALLRQLPASGVIYWNGVDARSWSRRELAKLVAYLPQAPTADQERVVDVLRTGRAPYWGAFGIESDSDVQAVRRISEQLGLGDLLSRPMSELSGGQRQRVFIGRCLVQQPKALLLDEPSTYLDLRHQVELSELLRRLSRQQGLGVLMASHDLNLAASSADRLVLLHDGLVAADGPPGHVLRPDLLSTVYGVPLRCIEVPGTEVPFVLPALP